MCRNRLQLCALIQQRHLRFGRRRRQSGGDLTCQLQLECDDQPDLAAHQQQRERQRHGGLYRGCQHQHDQSCGFNYGRRENLYGQSGRRHHHLQLCDQSGERQLRVGCGRGQCECDGRNRMQLECDDRSDLDSHNQQRQREWHGGIHCGCQHQHQFAFRHDHNRWADVHGESVSRPVCFYT